MKCSRCGDPTIWTICYNCRMLLEGHSAAEQIKSVKVLLFERLMEIGRGELDKHTDRLIYALYPTVAAARAAYKTWLTTKEIT